MAGKAFGTRAEGSRQQTERPMINKYYKPETVKFLAVGASGTVVNLGLTFLFKEKAGLDPVIANGIGFVVSVFNNYTWNSLWTFGQKRTVTALGKYLTVSGFTLALNLGIVYVLTKGFGVWYLASAAVGIAAAVSVNYLFSRGWVWKKSG